MIAYDMFQLMIAYDMFYYIKFTALSIKTICRALSLSFKDISSLLRSAILKSEDSSEEF